MSDVRSSRCPYVIEAQGCDKKMFISEIKIARKEIYPFLEVHWLPNRQEQHSHQVLSVRKAVDRGGFDFDSFDDDVDGMAKSVNFAGTSLVRDSYHVSSSFVSYLFHLHLRSWRVAGF